MALKTHKPRDETPTGPGQWIISFNDCMTNLLCFFVLLLSFSSFDPQARCRVTGVLRSLSNASIFDEPMEARPSVAPPQNRVFDFTEEGSDRPTDSAPQAVTDPRLRPPVPEVDPYCLRKVLLIPSGRLFQAQGRNLSAEGRERLKLIASYMKLMPCQAIIGECSSAGLSGLRIKDWDLERSWSILEYFTAEANLPPGRFAVSRGGKPPPGLPGGPMVEIVLLAEEAFR